MSAPHDADRSNAQDAALPWHNSAYHVAARYKVLADVLAVQVHFVEIEVGGRVLPHAPGMVQLFYCLEGEATFLLDEAELATHRGDCVTVGRRSVRGIINRGTTPLRLLLIQPQVDPIAVARAWLRAFPFISR